MLETKTTKIILTAKGRSPPTAALANLWLQWSKKITDLEKTKLEMEIIKLVSDVKKTSQEYKWYPYVIGGSLVAVGIGIAQLFGNG